MQAPDLAQLYPLIAAGRLEEAERAASDRLADAPEAGEAAALHGLRARLAWEARDPTRTLARVEEALETARAAGAATEAALATATRAQVRAWLGQLDGARDDAEAVLSDRQAPALARAWASRALGQVGACTGRTEITLRRCDEALGQLREGAPQSAEMAAIYLEAAEALLDRDGPVDASAAAARLAEARDHIDAANVTLLRRPLSLLLARARGATGDGTGAMAELERLNDTSSEDAPLRWKILAATARLHEERGATFLARKRWAHAVEVLESIATALPRDLRERFWSDERRQLVRKRAAGEGEVAAHSPEPAVPLHEGRLGRLLDIVKRLASETDLDRLLERITDSAIELTGAERGFVLLVDANEQLLPRTVRDVANPDDPHAAFSRSIAEAVLIDGEPILTVDARDDHRLSEYLSVHKLMLKSVACLPIRGRSGTVGVLYLEHRMRRGRFGESDLDLLLAFADQAAIALENARLMGRLEERRRELEEANEELANAKAEIERLLDAKTAELAEARSELFRARDALRQANDRYGIVGRSDRMRRVFAVIDRVQDADVPVVIQGESGTGKELIARAIHFGSARAQEPFVPLNCAAIPEALLESELFGHVRGAFTGADRDRTGVIVRASGGTLFLDEVGDMPAKMQVDLLRVLQDRKVRPVGSEEEVTVDIRVIAASNKGLTDLVAKGEFREDLYYRLNVVELWLPPLRDRHGDIPLLCEHFLAKFAERDGVEPKRISRDAIQRILQHPLPGNVRQLEHILLSAWVMADGDVIDADDLGLAGDGTRLPLPPRIERALTDDEESLPSAVRSASDPPPASFGEYKDHERQRILEALEAHNWNRVKAAKAVGMARRTFYRRLREFNIL